ncbi:hypothetical protein AVEN_269439-1 [Araneus ventricosus]|uniref:Uncharacterized protein n=1 Tax=Araneus ventricosus TaxID=182803 RepID=A0A4Y2X9G0_ARAVE|nr:hypothetical protein AVEN_269439-1 [Araneus ventricosus]
MYETAGSSLGKREQCYKATKSFLEDARLGDKLGDLAINLDDLAAKLATLVTQREFSRRTSNFPPIYWFHELRDMSLLLKSRAKASLKPRESELEFDLQASWFLAKFGQNPSTEVCARPSVRVHVNTITKSGAFQTLEY